jgi:predicted MFS family arabinose efflux permease
MLRMARANYAESSDNDSRGQPVIDQRKVIQFWIAYLTSVFAGLMAIGHAAGIALSKAASTELATLAAIAIGVGSTIGGFLSGWLVDRWPASRFLVGLPLLSAFALLGISSTENAVAAVVLLSLVGFSYGSLIAIYPVAIANYFSARGPQAYGRVFIAWGFAGLVAPWSAGLIYDLRGGYGLAMVIAAAIAILSALCAATFRLGKPA